VKTTIDIPDAVMEEAMRFTGASAKREAIVTAVERFNRLKRLNARVHGQFKDFMTLDELKVMRESD
jgi:Arc/MetJ family transcription regulator